jgi:CBS domain-containing protein
MAVEALMTRQVASCNLDDTLEQAARIMWDHDCGWLPVCAPGASERRRVVGVITDRDICMSALFKGKPLAMLRVADVMSKEVLACRASDTVKQAHELMRRGRVRRAPVLDAEGHLSGAIALADLVRQAIESTRQGRTTAQLEVGYTLAAICARPAALRTAG